MAKVNPTKGNDTISKIFHRTYSNLISFYIGGKIVKDFNGFYN